MEKNYIFLRRNNSFFDSALNNNSLKELTVFPILCTLLRILNQNRIGGGFADSGGIDIFRFWDTLTHTHTHKHTHARVNLQTLKHKNTQTHIYTNTNAQTIKDMYSNTLPYNHTNTCTSTYTSINAHTDTYTHNL